MVTEDGNRELCYVSMYVIVSEDVLVSVAVWICIPEWDLCCVKFQCLW